MLRRFNALNAISEDGSLLTVPPWVNPYLLLAMASSFIMHFVILYVPFLSSIFEIAPHSIVEWIIVVAFSFPVIVIGTYPADCPASLSHLQCVGVFLSWPTNEPNAVDSDEVLKAVGRSMNATERAARAAAMEEAKKKA